MHASASDNNAAAIERPVTIGIEPEQQETYETDSAMVVGIDDIEVDVVPGATNNEITSQADTEAYGVVHTQDEPGQLDEQR